MLETAIARRVLAALDALAPVGVVGALGKAAEVMAGVLAIAITVVAIVTELAANRYTHRIPQLLVRDPVNVAVMALLVAVVLQALWVAAWLGDDDVTEPRGHGRRSCGTAAASPWRVSRNWRTSR